MGLLVDQSRPLLKGKLEPVGAHNKFNLARSENDER